MKRKQFLSAAAIILLLTLAQQATAKIWRVNNKSNYNGATLWGDNLGGTAAYPVFTQVNQAVLFGIVNSGDTVHTEGSTVVYDDAALSKRLVLIGTGYFLTDNPNTASSTLDTRIGRVSFNAGSEGSQAIGLNVINNGNTADGYIYVTVNGCTIKRCRIERAVWFQTLLADVYILQNFFPNVIIQNCLSTNGNNAFVPPTDIVFNNNICQKTLLWGTPLANPTTFWPILQCNNNVLDGPDNLATPQLAFSTSEFSNNILMPTNAIVNIAASSGVISHNIGTLSTQFGTSNNNLVVPAIITLFAASASRDGTYQVADGTAADNSGKDGTDRGAFGGAAITSRYTLSGLAPIPVVYEITTAGIADASGLPVTIRARTIK
ncbi:MAG: hypothetical protein H7Z13_20610 [Ferruginibacter sp.]|nr:hypothetical protein [Ferruginibacter sp.]